jgi:nucleoside-diphosphate-sugar epimerase
VQKIFIAGHRGLVGSALTRAIDLREDTIFECDRRLDGTAFERETGIVVPSWNEMLQEFALDQSAYI